MPTLERKDDFDGTSGNFAPPPPSDSASHSDFYTFGFAPASHSGFGYGYGFGRDNPSFEADREGAEGEGGDVDQASPPEPGIVVWECQLQEEQGWVSVTRESFVSASPLLPPANPALDPPSSPPALRHALQMASLGCRLAIAVTVRECGFGKEWVGFRASGFTRASTLLPVPARQAPRALRHCSRQPSSPPSTRPPAPPVDTPASPLPLRHALQPSLSSTGKPTARRVASGIERRIRDGRRTVWVEERIWSGGLVKGF